MRKRSTRAKSAYPHRGTPRGDEPVGACQAVGCGRLLRRGDAFVTLVGDVLICRPCHETPGMRAHRPASHAESDLFHQPRPVHLNGHHEGPATLAYAE